MIKGTEATEARFFAQESSLTHSFSVRRHMISVCFYGNRVWTENLCWQTWNLLVEVDPCAKKWGSVASGQGSNKRHHVHYKYSWAHFSFNKIKSCFKTILDVSVNGREETQRPLKWWSSWLSVLFQYLYFTCCFYCVWIRSCPGDLNHTWNNVMK